MNALYVAGIVLCGIAGIVLRRATILAIILFSIGVYVMSEANA